MFSRTDMTSVVAVISASYNGGIYADQRRQPDSESLSTKSRTSREFGLHLVPGKLHGSHVLFIRETVLASLGIHSTDMVILHRAWRSKTHSNVRRPPRS